MCRGGGQGQPLHFVYRQHVVDARGGGSSRAAFEFAIRHPGRRAPCPRPGLAHQPAPSCLRTRGDTAAPETKNICWHPCLANKKTVRAVLLKPLGRLRAEVQLSSLFAQLYGSRHRTSDTMPTTAARVASWPPVGPVVLCWTMYRPQGDTLRRLCCRQAFRPNKRPRNKRGMNRPRI